MIDLKQILQIPHKPERPRNKTHGQKVVFCSLCSMFSDVFVVFPIKTTGELQNWCFRTGQEKDGRDRHDRQEVHQFVMWSKSIKNMRL